MQKAGLLGLSLELWTTGTFCFYSATFLYVLNFLKNSQSGRNDFCLKDHPKIANYKPKGMNFCCWNYRHYGKCGDGETSGISVSVLHRPLLSQPSYIYNCLWHSDFKIEMQPLEQVWVKPTYVKEAGLWLVPLILRKIACHVISEGCKESIHLTWKIKNNPHVHH